MNFDQTSAKPQWYSIKEAAEYLGVTEPTIYRWMRDGQITFRKIGDATRFLQADLDGHVQVFRSVKDAENVQEYCPVCHHTEFVKGNVRSTGINYFYPSSTKFWTFATSHVETQAHMCTRCGAILWFGDKIKLNALKKPKTGDGATEPSPASDDNS